ncbi:hypothetical protein N7526_011426 [Penicillium atrosanguineum]|nr:hypothetical protein N7526_011426 [Penicillium atrosanguineum]
MAQSTEFYGYLPSEPAALFGVAYFGTAVLVCILQIIFGTYKHYWMITLALAAAGEAIGWGGRLWAHFAVCQVIITPNEGVIVADFISASQLDAIHDPNLQSHRGVLVSSAQNHGQLDHGSSVMRSGIIFQFSNTVMFVALVSGTILRLRTKGIRLSSVTGWPVMVAMWVSTVMVFVRNAYRIAELSGGWKGHLMRTEGYLVGLDMVPMAVAVGSFVVFSPSLFFCYGKQEKERKRARSSDCVPLR